MKGRHSPKRNAMGYYQYLNNTSAQKRKMMNATQQFSSSKLGVKPAKSKSVVKHKPNLGDETRSEINDTILKEKTTNNSNNTPVDLLILAG